jgi:hypothetical protein
MNPVANISRSWQTHVMNAISTCLVAMVSSVALLGTVGTAQAIRPAAPVAATPSALLPESWLQIRPSAGFVDDIIWADATSLVYLVTDGATKIEAHVVNLSTKAEIVVDLPTSLLSPVAIRIVDDKLVVIAKNGSKRVVQWVKIAATVDSGKPGKAKLAAVPKAPGEYAAAEFIDYKGKPAVSLFSAKESGKSSSLSVQVLDAGTGKRIAKSRSLTTDSPGVALARGWIDASSLNFKIYYWTEGRTKAHGIKGGVFVKADDRRGADQEAVYDMLTGKFVIEKPIADLTSLRKRFESLPTSLAPESLSVASSFVRITKNLAGIEVWQSAQMREVEGVPLSKYKTSSLSSAIDPDGTIWLGLSIEPTNAAALAAKTVDAAMFDVYKVSPGGTRAERAFRIAADNKDFAIGRSGGAMWLAERNRGISRGSKSVEVRLITK